MGTSNLGVAHFEGLGTKRNPIEAIKWTGRAARQGDAEAQYNLGMAYRDGEGVRQNRKHARNWLNKAAKQGSQEGFYLNEGAGADNGWLTRSVRPSAVS
jgi:uncharacterized protein